MSHSMIPVAKLTRGIAVDLQGDPFADPNLKVIERGLGRKVTEGETLHPEFAFEYQQVDELVRETADCIVVYFDSFACGFPPDHLLKCRRDTLPIELYRAYPESRS